MFSYTVLDHRIRDLRWGKRTGNIHVDCGGAGKPAGPKICSEAPLNALITAART